MSQIKFLALLLVAAGSLTSRAQDLPDVAQGLQPYVAYYGGNLDQISTVNGGLTLRIPLASYAQKGSLELTYSVVFNSFGYQDIAQCDQPYDPTGPIISIPLKKGCTNQIQIAPVGIPNLFPLGPRLTADQLLWPAGSNATEPYAVQHPSHDVRYVVIGSDNAEHVLGQTSDGYRSLDESEYLFAPQDAPTEATGTAELAYPGDQTVLLESTPGTVLDNLGTSYTTSGITDVDGNVLSISNGLMDVVSGNFGLPATDSTGRSIPAPSAVDLSKCPVLTGAPFQPLSYAQAWTPPGSGDGFIFCYAAVNISTHYIRGSGIHGGDIQGSSDLYTGLLMLQSIVLPNHTSWGFIYDSADPNNYSTGLGQLMRLILPTGGAIQYGYSDSQGICNTARISGLVEATIFPHNLQVSSRSMFDSTGTLLGTWQYTYPGGELRAATGSILSPSGNLTQTLFTPDGSHCGIIDAGQHVFQGAVAIGTPIKSTATTYITTAFPGFPSISSNKLNQTILTAANGSSASTTMSYMPGILFSQTQCSQSPPYTCGAGLGVALPIGKPYAVTYQGFDGTITKQEKTTFQWQSHTEYLSANLLDLPADTSLFDSGGTLLSKENYFYDEGFNSPGGVRGHLTTMSRLGNGLGGSITTYAGWNSAGMKSFTIDADASASVSGHLNKSGHTIDYKYGTGQCSALITSTTNAADQVTSGTYDCNTGLLDTLTDPNGQTTTVAWDSMRRLQSVTSPSVTAGTPITSFTYDDIHNSVTRTVAASPDPTQTLTVDFDGLGREIQRVTSDKPYADVVDTTYDSEGRVASISNPYRTTQDPTYGLTQYTYDALNRKIFQVQPDGSTLQWCFDGVASSSTQTICSTNQSSLTDASWVDSADEAGTVMQHVTDSLGRLRAVVEPGSLQTSYTYDLLNNLSTVLQSGTGSDVARTRTFGYDSLSRLLWSKNPETGVICYGQGDGTTAGCNANGYDPNGNLLYKTDARGTTTNYTYDGLNRLTTKISPQDGETNFGYSYDQGTNGIGRLYNAWRPGVAGTIYDYDPMGRVASTSWFNYIAEQYQPGVSAQYDLAGNVTGLTYPDQRVVSQTWDPAGHLSSVTDATAGGPQTVYFGAATYLPSGALSSAQFGNGVQESMALNNRLQPCHLWANSPLLAPALLAGTPIGNLYDRQAFYAQTAETNCGAAVANNGNIWSILEANSAGFPSQNFLYDGLNRLISASTLNRPAATSYNHTYKPDSFGNMLKTDHLAANLAYDIDAATNRLTLNGTLQTGDLRYDAAGNLIQAPDPFSGTPRTMMYTAEGSLRAISAGGSPYGLGSYLYNAEGQRTFADQNNTTWNEYVYFNAQPIADVDNTGKWSDLIYADGKKIAKVDSARPLMHLHLNRTADACNLPMAVGGINLSGMPINPGDIFAMSVKATSGVQWGAGFLQGNGQGMDLPDQNGNDMAVLSLNDGAWHHEVGNLGAYAPSTIAQLQFVIQAGTAPGPQDVWLKDLVIEHADGSVMPILTTNQLSLTPLVSGSALSVTPQSFCAGSGVTLDFNPSPIESAEGVSYFLDDHLGTTQMELSAGGWPVWQGWFTPYGQEIGQPATSVGPQNDDGTANRYKFTGKERDSESGLDYFGARYYASNMGRFMSPDWSSSPSPVPYANLRDPQTLNLYIYGGNNPLTGVDPDGHCDWCQKIGNFITGNGYKTDDEVTAARAKMSSEDMVKSDIIRTNAFMTIMEGSISVIPGGGEENNEEADRAELQGEEAIADKAIIDSAQSAPMPSEGVYQFPDAQAPGKTYVGQSGDIPSRLDQHAQSGKLADGSPIQTTAVPGGRTAREVVETGQIKQLGGTQSQPGSQTSNQRLPVSDKRMEKIKNGSQQ